MNFAKFVRRGQAKLQWTTFSNACVKYRKCAVSKLWLYEWLLCIHSLFPKLCFAILGKKSGVYELVSVSQKVWLPCCLLEKGCMCLWKKCRSYLLTNNAQSHFYVVFVLFIPRKTTNYWCSVLLVVFAWLRKVSLPWNLLTICHITTSIVVNQLVNQLFLGCIRYVKELNANCVHAHIDWLS